MMKFAALPLTTMLILSGCASAPVECPRLPPPPALGPAAPSYQDRMRDFLSGSLPKPTEPGPTLNAAGPGLNR